MKMRHVLQFLVVLMLPICLVSFFVLVMLLLFWFAAGEMLDAILPIARQQSPASRDTK